MHPGTNLLQSTLPTTTQKFLKRDFTGDEDMDEEGQTTQRVPFEHSND